MDFNIQNYIQKIKERIPEHSDKQKIYLILKDIIPGISSENIHLHAGLLRIRDVSPAYLTRLRLKKQIYIQKIKDQGIHLRDII